MIYTKFQPIPHPQKYIKSTELILCNKAGGTLNNKMIAVNRKVA